jgi:hypothetical protein
MTASENYQSAYGIVLALSFAVPGHTGDESICCPDSDTRHRLSHLRSPRNIPQPTHLPPTYLAPPTRNATEHSTANFSPPTSPTLPNHANTVSTHAVPYNLRSAAPWEQPTHYALCSAPCRSFHASPTFPKRHLRLNCTVPIHNVSLLCPFSAACLRYVQSREYIDGILWTLPCFMSHRGVGQ